MTSPDLSLGPEWALLELLVIGLDEPNADAAFSGLLQSGELNWGELVNQAVRHAVLPLLAFNLTQDKYEKRVPTEVLVLMHQVLNVNRHRIAILRNHAARLARALRERNTGFVATKGITFESTLYDGSGSRYMLDIDFMIMPKDREVVTQVMTSLSYEPATYDP